MTNYSTQTRTTNCISPCTWHKYTDLQSEHTIWYTKCGQTFADNDDETVYLNCPFCGCKVWLSYDESNTIPEILRAIFVLCNYVSIIAIPLIVLGFFGLIAVVTMKSNYTPSDDQFANTYLIIYSLLWLTLIIRTIGFQIGVLKD